MEGRPRLLLWAAAFVTLGLSGVIAWLRAPEPAAPSARRVPGGGRRARVHSSPARTVLATPPTLELPALEPAVGDEPATPELDPAATLGDESAPAAALEPRVPWSGVLRTESGALLGGVERLRVDEAGGARSFVIPCDAFGRFAAELPAGAWRVSIPTASGALELAGFELDDLALAQDLIVPGVCLSGTVRRSDELRDAAEELFAVDVDLRCGADGAPRPADLRAGSRYTFLALAPGTYYVTTTPRPLLGAPPGGLCVRVGTGARERMTLDLLVGQR